MRSKEVFKGDGYHSSKFSSRDVLASESDERSPGASGGIYALGIIITGLHSQAPFHVALGQWIQTFLIALQDNLNGELAGFCGAFGVKKGTANVVLAPCHRSCP